MPPGAPQVSDDFLGSPLRRNWIWTSFQVAMRIIFAVWLRYRARGLEHGPANGGGLILANHQSFLDPLLIGLPLRRPISFLARENLFHVPVIGWILRRTYVMPINQMAGTAGIRLLRKRLEQGFLVGVFPEGSRSPDGVVGEVKGGFVAVARRSDEPIIPVGIAGAYRALGLGAWFLKPYRVCVVFGQAFTPEEIAPLKEKGREAELIAAVRQRIIDCQQEAEAWLQHSTANQVLTKPAPLTRDPVA